MSKTFLFQAIQFSQTVLIQTIQFSIRMQFSSIWPRDRALSGANIPGQSGPGSNRNEGIFCIPRNTSITGTSPLECLVSYPGHSFGGKGYISLQRHSQCILQLQPTGQDTQWRRKKKLLMIWIITELNQNSSINLSFKDGVHNNQIYHS